MVAEPHSSEPNDFSASVFMKTCLRMLIVHITIGLILCPTIPQILVAVWSF